MEEVEAAGIDFVGPVYAANPLELASWPARLIENSPGYVPTDAPILILQSEDDPPVPILLTNAFYDRLYQIGSQPDYRVFRGLGHDETSKVKVPLMLEWAAARFAGEPAVSTCD